MHLKALWFVLLSAAAGAAAQDAVPAAAPAAAPPLAATGKVLVDIKPFESEVPLKPKVENQLKSGGLEWGAKDGKLVFTMVNKRFVNFDVNQFTRYGQQTTLDLPAGDYKVTGIGLVMSTGFSPEKILNKGAYLNEDVIAFRVEPGQTTTVTIRPVIRKQRTFFLNFFMPELMTSVTAGGAPSEEVSICDRTDKSTPWATYAGPLKFKSP